MKLLPEPSAIEVPPLPVKDKFSASLIKLVLISSKSICLLNLKLIFVVKFSEIT